MACDEASGIAPPHDACTCGVTRRAGGTFCLAPCTKTDRRAAAVGVMGVSMQGRTRLGGLSS